MNTNVYIISMHETEDSTNFGVSFHPEVYLNKDKAEKRLAFLKSELGEYSGFYYSFECLRTKDF